MEEAKSLVQQQSKRVTILPSTDQTSGFGLEEIESTMSFGLVSGKGAATVLSAADDNNSNISRDAMTTIHENSDHGNGHSRRFSLAHHSSDSFKMRRGSSIFRNLAEGSKVEEEFELEEDVFGILFVADPFSFQQIIPLIVVSVQIVILALIRLDIMNDDDRPTEVVDKNLFNIPVAVDKPVSVSQAFAVLVATLMQEGALVSLDALFLAHYDPNCKKIYPNATLLAWKVTNFMRWVIGVLTLLVSLLIISQSTDVLEIFMNFAAVHFVDRLDDVAFQLAAGGYFGVKLQECTVAVRSITFKRIRSQWRIMATQASFTITVSLLLGGWGVFRVGQKTGVFMSAEACKSVFFKFEDDYFITDPLKAPMFYSNFGGRYIGSFKSDSRPVYYERSLENVTDQTARFYYCDPDKSWHFTIPALAEYIPDGTKHPCKEGWLMQSPVTDEYLLENVPLEGWKMIVLDGAIKHNAQFVKQCSSCKRKTDCSFHGACDDGTCVCEPNRTGIFCEVALPFCSGLIHFNYGNSLSEYDELGMYYLAKVGNETIMAYGRPIYVLNSFNEDGCGKIIIYGGNRWVEDYRCISELYPNFHAYWSFGGKNQATVSYSFSFSDSTDNYLPYNVGWNLESSTGSRGSYGSFGVFYELTDARFECRNVTCEDAPCGAKGKCIQTETGDYRCQCIDFTGGYYCEHASLSPYSQVEYFQFREFIDSKGYPNVSFDELDESIENALAASSLSVGPKYYRRYWRPFIQEELRGN